MATTNGGTASRKQSAEHSEHTRTIWNRARPGRRPFRVLRVFRGSLSLLLLAPSLTVAQGPRPAKPDDLAVYITGNAADAVVTPAGPAFLLIGGSTDVDAAFSNRALPATNGGDVVVLRTSGRDGYNNYLFSQVAGAIPPDSVESMVVDTVDEANTTYVEWVIDTAEFVWFAGGDQSTYINNWQGTKVQAAVQRLVNRGGIVGGTSAGLAILGEWIYDPDAVSASTGASAIANPYEAGMIISDRLFTIPILDDVITDTHFAQRDRMGRPFAFMARLRQDGRATRVRAIAVDERTSLWIPPSGIGVVDGTNAVYLLSERPDTTRTQVTAGQPLVYGPLDRVRLTNGQTFNLNTWSPAGVMPLAVDGTSPTVWNFANPYGAYVAPTPTPTPTATPTPTPSDSMRVH